MGSRHEKQCCSTNTTSCRQNTSYSLLNSTLEKLRPLSLLPMQEQGLKQHLKACRLSWTIRILILMIHSELRAQLPRQQSSLQGLRMSQSLHRLHTCWMTAVACHASFFCPITWDVMPDPVVAVDGHTYELEAILQWLNQGHKTSPMTKEQLQSFLLVPNRSLRAQIIAASDSRVSKSGSLD